MIIFDWINTFKEVANNEWKGDEDPFQIEISQTEGEYASAIVLLKNPKCGLFSKLRKPYAKIGWKDPKGNIYVIFCGKVIGFPIDINNSCVKLEFISKPENADQQLENLLNKLKITPYWDPLFIDEHHVCNTTEVLEARTEIYYWDRVTGELFLSDFYYGRRKFSLFKEVFPDSLKVHVGADPIDAVNVKVIAEWIQRASGCINLAPIIAKSFKGEIINTYTGAGFKSSWEGINNKLANSGYYINYASIEEIFPPYTGILNIYPRVSPPYLLENDMSEGPEITQPKQETVKLKRWWFKGKLIASWNYQQKRKEIVEFSLKNEHQKINSINNKEKSLVFHLQSISPSCDSLYGKLILNMKKMI